MDPMAAIKETYFEECGELLSVVEQNLLVLQDTPDDDEAINAIFRAVHSIKGGGGAFRLDQLVDYSHKLETTLDELRGGKIEPTAQLVRLLLRASDLLEDLVQAAQEGSLIERSRIDEVLAELSHFSGPSVGKDEADENVIFGFEPVRIDLDADEVAVEQTDACNAYCVRIRPAAGLYANGNEITRLLAELGRLGHLEVDCVETDAPPLEALDVDDSCLEWRGRLVTSRPLIELVDVFEFVDGYCTFDIIPEEAGGQERRLSDASTLESSGVITQRATQEGAAEVNEAMSPGGESTTNSSSLKGAKIDKKGSIRVDLERVDRLINLVGELVINQSMLAQSVSDADVGRRATILRGLDDLEQLTRDIQDCVMALRAQPVRSLFQRMSRVVREVGDATGKGARLATEGDATEIDRTVIERLSDPLTHMIRNAVDHGLEPEDVRRRNGKTAEGVITLSAAHRSGRVVIEVSDDGGGINRDRVKKLAQDKGLIPTDAQLADSDIDNLLFLPGFSTSREVSDISGRGVGLDVVRSSIQALGGRISISSAPGVGTKFSLSVPLTLAVVDGMIIHAEGQTLVVPLTAIVESIKPKPSDIHPLGVSCLVLANRGAFTPIVDVAYELGYRTTPSDPLAGVLLLVESESGMRCALCVDAIHDQRQVVIKSLEENYGRVPGIAAATILGDGHVALILDVDAIVAGTTRASTLTAGSSVEGYAQ